MISFRATYPPVFQCNSQNWSNRKRSGEQVTPFPFSNTAQSHVSCVIVTPYSWNAKLSVRWNAHVFHTCYCWAMSLSFIIGAVGFLTQISRWEWNEFCYAFVTYFSMLNLILLELVLCCNVPKFRGMLTCFSFQSIFMPIAYLSITHTIHFLSLKKYWRKLWLEHWAQQ